MRRNLLRVTSFLVALILSTVTCGGQATAVQDREPAAVISPGGARWLERPGRAAEDRPEIVIQSMQLENGDVVAEVGAGTGFFTRRLAVAVAPDGVVWANDIQPEMLELMRDYLERDGITNVRQVLGDEDDPKLPPDTFDWILLVDVYHEFQKPVPMLEGIRRALAPDGREALVEYRAEGNSAARIGPKHKMTREQVLAEWIPAGFVLEKVVEALPAQHMFIFRKRQATE